MEDDEDRELEHYVWQHKKESLRQIQEGMEKEFGRTKSTKWITPRRDAALEVEVEFPTEEEILDEGEEKDETLKDETESEDDPEITEIQKQIKNINLQKRRVEAERKLQVQKTELKLAQTGHKKVGDLENHFNFLKELRKADRKHIRLLTTNLEHALILNPNHHPGYECPRCKGEFLYYSAGIGEKFHKCYVCGRDYTIDED